MPIKTDSDAWQSGDLIDRLGTNIGDNLLRNNPDTAYTIEEIAEWILDEYPGTIPQQLRDYDDNQGTFAFVSAALDRLDRRNFVTCRVVTEDNGAERLYYTHYGDGDSYYPNVELKHDVRPRIEDLEDEIESLPDDLADQLSYLHYEVSKLQE